MLPSKPPSAPVDDDMEEAHLMEYDDIRGFHPGHGRSRGEAYEEDDDGEEMRGPGCAHQ